MKGIPVIYLGRSILKEGFRAFVYGINDTTKLANSWDEFQNLVSSGLWFATKEDVPVIKAKKKLSTEGSE